MWKSYALYPTLYYPLISKLITEGFEGSKFHHFIRLEVFHYGITFSEKLNIKLFVSAC